MKVGIITFHFVNNFGGALQTYALSKTVSKLCGETADVIDYRNRFISFTDFVRYFPITLNPGEFFEGMKTFSKRSGRKRKFLQFQKEYFSLSEKYISAWELKKNPPVYDYYICGSDQIWNPVITLGVDSAYYLDFVRNGDRKISYAASFGISKMKKQYLNKIRRYLKDFQALSVREKEGALFAQNLMQRKITQLIDPTFLLTREEWDELAVSSLVKGKYMLVYVMQNNKEVYEYARKIKEILGLKLVAISRYGYKLDFIDEVRIDVGPREYVGLFRDASFVCTNSFHGLAFSLIFEKNFYIIPSTRFNSRIDNLMDVLQLGNYKELTKETLGKPNYSREQVKEIISHEKKKALEFLNTIFCKEESNA